MGAGAWILGVVALLSGIAIGNARAKKQAALAPTPPILPPAPEPQPPAPPTAPSTKCSNTAVAMWAQSIGLTAAVIDTPAVIALTGAPSNFDVLVTQSDCTAYTWDGSAWVIDEEKTADMRAKVGF